MADENFAEVHSEAIPQMVDKASSGGSILDFIGGATGALGFAKKLFST